MLVQRGFVQNDHVVQTLTPDRSDHALAMRVGTKSGRSLGRPRCVFDRDAVRTMRTAGKSWRAIATQLGVGVGTVRRACERKPIGRELAGAVNATGAA